jgi:hypothetical protein
MHYSGANRGHGTVFEISAGRIDIGADLSWISQYPGEKEFLFPPLSCLEVNGEPRVEEGVVIVPLRVNICLKGLTLEQLQERRKELHISMLKNLEEELALAGATVVVKMEGVSGLGSSDRCSYASCLAGSVLPDHDALCFQLGTNGDAYSEDTQGQHKLQTLHAIVDDVKSEFRRLKELHMLVEAGELNTDDRKYKLLTAEAIDGKSLGLKKLEFAARMLERGDGALMERILRRPLMDFSIQGIEDELLTGLVGFPWGQVKGKRATVEFGQWTPEGAEPSQLKAALAALKDNHQMSSVSVGPAGETSQLVFKDGWGTESIEWGSSAAVRAFPSVACLILQCFHKASHLFLG